jgi:hypothetical protein
MQKPSKSIIWTCKRRVRVMRRRKESVGFVMPLPVARMGIPFLYPSTSALTA